MAGGQGTTQLQAPGEPAAPLTPQSGVTPPTLPNLSNFSTPFQGMSSSVDVPGMSFTPNAPSPGFQFPTQTPGMPNSYGLSSLRNPFQALEAQGPFVPSSPYAGQGGEIDYGFLPTTPPPQFNATPPVQTPANTGGWRSTRAGENG